MSVLTDLAISYETLPGEPSFFNFFEDQPAASGYREYSMPVIKTTVQKTHAHNQIQTISTEIKQVQHNLHTQRIKHTKPSFTEQSVAPASLRQVTQPIARTTNRDLPQPIARTARPASTESRGLFNDFERAALFSHMQARTPVLTTQRQLI
ncbi:MAG: hypothetical protein WCO19_01395 [Candidatus Saccharibacteria bacterium]